MGNVTGGSKRKSGSELYKKKNGAKDGSGQDICSMRKVRVKNNPGSLSQSDNKDNALVICDREGEKWIEFCFEIIR